MIDVNLTNTEIAMADGRALKKVGLIALATDLTVERDICRILTLDSACVYVNRVEFANPTTPENLAKMAPKIAAAAAQIVPETKLDAICYACTSASVVIGDAAIKASINSAHPNVPVVTPSGAAIAAFKALGASKISVLTPYLVETSIPVARYFEGNGLEIECFECLGLEDDRDMARVQPEAILQAALAAERADTEAFFLSCTALRSVDVIAELEKRTGKPVVTSNQASAWALMQHAGLVQRSDRWGRLFACSLN